MSWYYLRMENEEMLAREDEIAKAMQSLGLAALGSGAAIYVHFDSHDGRHHYYFSPKAEPVALMFGARAWNKPAREAIGSFAVGDPSLFQSLYP
ncbi:hypothetical protein [Piscinibacter gummiphilus]|uniref:Uncharacterized protein n=1 Tax=Piscinibacter gummiphilus TaxID=946333 RepID=A0ABZ0CWP7_9BURK|nr:hypothetical protein [Piscinibacter gummiphilus]WOB06914.1 hypothetical protein RXV79_18550 [Piscinibacter gummiphilus]